MPGPAHPRLALSGYVDGRLPGWRRLVVERHLRGCTRCAVEVAQVRAVRRLLVATDPPPPAPELTERLLAIGRVAPDHAAARPPARPPVPGQRRRVAVGAAGVLVAGVVLVGAVGAGAVGTVAPGSWSGTAGTASLSTVLPRLWSWPGGPDGAATVRPVDNGDRP